MEVQGSLRLLLWTGLSCILLLSGTLEIRGANIYMVPGHPLNLNVPNCAQVSESDSIEWQDEANRLAKWKKIASYYHYCISNQCTIHANGSLTIHKPQEKTTTYTVIVYKDAGVQKCKENVTVIMEEELEQPDLSYNCTSVGVSVSCSTSAIKTTNLTLSWGTKVQNTLEKSIIKSIKEQNVPVQCIVKNRVQEREKTVTINCPVWDLYLIVSVAGGGVALIIFIALVFYSVKYKPWRSRSRTEEDVEISRPQLNTAQRQLPPPMAPSSGVPGDSPGHCLIQKPLTPHRPDELTPEGRKGKQSRSRRLPPPAPGQTATMCETTPAPQQTTPALPGNHPSEQAPRPQPRTKSKPPRQSRKSRQ